MTNQPIKVGNWLIESETNQIHCDDKTVSLRPQAMDLLVFLAHRNGDVISTETLIEEIWFGMTVSSGSVYNCITELRHAFGDSTESPQYIETIAKRGYRLIAETSGGMNSDPLHNSKTVASIAILPFVNMSADPDLDYFSEGLSEELLNLLTHIPALHLASHMASFQFKGENHDIIELGHKLHVGYILEGSARKAGDQIRITAQLIDASNGFHVWSETYDHIFDNIFSLQDEISGEIVDALKKKLLL